MLELNRYRRVLSNWRERLHLNIHPGYKIQVNYKTNFGATMKRKTQDSKNVFIWSEYLKQLNNQSETMTADYLGLNNNLSALQNDFQSIELLKRVLRQDGPDFKPAQRGSQPIRNNNL